MIEWTLFLGEEKRICFRGKLGLVRTLRRDEFVIAEAETDKHSTSFNDTIYIVLGRKAWRGSSLGKKDIMKLVDLLNKGMISPTETLEEIERSKAKGEENGKD
jgi:hypothetical protein